MKFDWSALTGEEIAVELYRGNVALKMSIDAYVAPTVAEVESVVSEVEANNTCERCGKKFPQTRPKRNGKEYVQRFCSRTCAVKQGRDEYLKQNKSQKTTDAPSEPTTAVIMYKCKVCGKDITQANRTTYCSDYCHDRSGEKKKKVKILDDMPLNEKIELLKLRDKLKRQASFA
jgi:hypothetical protein